MAAGSKRYLETTMERCVMRRSDRNRPAFLLEFREDDEAAEVAIVKVLRSDGGPDGFHEVWSHRFTNREAGQAVFELLRARPTRFGTWGRMAELLGPRFLDGVIDTELGSPVVADAVASPHSSRSRARTDRPTGAENGPTVRLALDGDVPRAVGTFEGRTFLLLGARTVTGVRRIWDWVRWQDDAYRGWVDLERDRGALALIRMILDSMIEQERSVIEAGPVRDPERPLRDWRPRSGQGER